MLARRFAVVLAVLASAPTLAVPAMGAHARPQVRLLAASTTVKVFTFGKGPVYLDLGTYIGVDGAPLRVDVQRPDYTSPVGAELVLGNGDRVAVPPGLLNGWRGLAHMVEIKVFRSGTQIHDRTFTFCPNSYDVQRIDADGPFDPTYPQDCEGNPFTLGTVWGIDRGWAANALGYGATMNLAKGWYRMQVSITPAYRSLLDIADADASVSLRVHVLKGGGCTDLCPVGAGHALAALGRRPTSAPTDTTPDPATLPDLVPLPAWGIQLDRFKQRDVLTFGATVWDAGPSSLIVEGYRQPNSDTMQAYEYFTRNGKVVGRAPVGTFEFDRRPGHEHWHFEQFARYRLLDAQQQNVVRSQKEGFCLAATDAIDLLRSDALWRPDSLGFSQCAGPTNLWIRETLPTGWGDTYQQSLPGQAFDMTKIPNGTYYIEITANPTGLLYESDTGNDRQLRMVVLHGKPGHRWISVPPWEGIDA